LLTLAASCTLVALLAIFMVPVVEIGMDRTTRFEMMVVGVPAIIGAIFGIIASLIAGKKPAPHSGSGD